MSRDVNVSVPETGTPTTTFLDLLRDQMDGLDRTRRRKKTLKERLRFKRIMLCCGPRWGLRQTSNVAVREEEERNDEEETEREGNLTGRGNGAVSDPSDSGMNLAAALAAERRYRGGTDNGNSGEMTPLRTSLLRLLEETAEIDGDRMAPLVGTGGKDSLCCVCMGRQKGAAFIPCGHTFCRVCSRELWLNRGSCPLCNRPILEILDIY